MSPFGALLASVLDQMPQNKKQYAVRRPDGIAIANTIADTQYEAQQKFLAQRHAGLEWEDYERLKYFTSEIKLDIPREV